MVPSVISIPVEYAFIELKLKGILPPYNSDNRAEFQSCPIREEVANMMQIIKPMKHIFFLLAIRCKIANIPK